MSAAHLDRLGRQATRDGGRIPGRVARHEPHFGRYTVDAARGVITFHIDAASFPNWEGAEQTRPFQLSGDELSWRVPATPDGTIPISVWRRVR